MRATNRSAIRILKRLAAAFGIAVALTVAWAGYLRLSGNFHAVHEGAVYRSGQLSGAQFAQRIKENGIRTIINLRGNNAGRPWYVDEMRASSTAGVQHVDFAISAGRELTDDQVSEVTSLLRDLPRPILIHCEAGADRSGLVSAIYKLQVDRRSAQEASQQLSFRYGHFPWLGSRTIAMDATFARVVARLPTSPAADSR